MKNIFQYFYSLFIVSLLSLPAMGAASEGLQQALAEQHRRHVPTAENGCRLARFVRSELESYYNKKDFSDPGHRVGWFRADRFLKWVAAQETTLVKEKIPYNGYGDIPVCKLLSSKADARIPYRKTLLAGYLGMRYMEDTFLPYGALRRPHFKINESSYEQGYAHRNDREIITTSASKVQKFSNASIEFLVTPALTDRFIMDLNVGMHEGVHLLAWMGGADESLSEFATFYTTSFFALPIKADQKDFWSKGVRGLSVYTEEDYPCENLFHEYASFILGAVLYPSIKHLSVFKFSGHYGDTTHALLSMVLALRAGRFYVWEDGAQSAFSSSAANYDLHTYDFHQAKEIILQHVPQCAEPLEDLARRVDEALRRAEEDKDSSNTSPSLSRTFLACGDKAVMVWEREGWGAHYARKATWQDAAALLAPMPELVPEVSEELKNMAAALADIPFDDDVVGINSVAGVAGNMPLCQAFKAYLRPKIITRSVVPPGYF